MPQLDLSSFPSQLFWLVVTFIFLYVVLKKAALPGVREVLQSRQDRITSDLDKAETAQKEAERVKATYTDSLGTARQKAIAMLAEASSNIQKEIALRNSELEADMVKRLDAAEKQIAQLRAEATAKMAPVTETVTQFIVDKLIHKKLDSAEITATLKNITH